MPWGLFRFSRIVFRHCVASYEAFSLQFSCRVYHCWKQNRLVAGNSMLVPVIRFPLGGSDNAIKALQWSSDESCNNTFIALFNT